MLFGMVVRWKKEKKEKNYHHHHHHHNKNFGILVSLDQAQVLNITDENWLWSLLLLGSQEVTTSGAKSLGDLGQLLMLNERWAVSSDVLGWIGIMHAQIDENLSDLNVRLGPDDVDVTWIWDQTWWLSWLIDHTLLWSFVWQPTVDNDLLWLSWTWWQVLSDHFTGWWWNNFTWNLICINICINK